VQPQVKATMADHPTPKLPADQLRDHEGPLAFLIPGNHDWYDNLDTYCEQMMSMTLLNLIR
jgi:hypothetical protein